MITRIGRYTILSKLGTGGSGDVWEAVLEGPAGFRKRVALKVVSGQGSEDGTLQREARLGALLRHVNHVDVYEVGQTDDGQTFLAMELVPGVALSTLIRHSGAVAGPALRDIAIQLARGLAYIHHITVDDTRGLVHRDIKPSNVLLDAAGIVKIADLGIARLAGTAVDKVEGTPGYLAPEQLEGHEPDPRADVFSTGVVLWAMAVRANPLRPGRRLAAAIRAAITAQDQAQRAVPLIRDALPGLEDIVLRCLDPDPLARFADGRELLVALRAIPEPSGEGLVELLTRVGPLLDDQGDRKTHTTDRTPHTTRLRPERGVLHGRSSVRDALLGQIEGPGWTTVKGLGGVGKSRVVQHVAHRWAKGGGLVAWAELSNALGRDAILGALAHGLAITLGENDPVRQIGQAIANRADLLVVLDGVEGCKGLVTELMATWREAAPDARWVLTSREALGHPDEVLVELGPMSPEAALALFEERLGRALSPEGRVTAAEVVRRLDHHPLAIELAAARAVDLGPQELLAAVQTRVGADPLADAVAWSWGQLPPWSRRALVQLSTFQGTFPVQAAEAVVDVSDWEDAPWPLDVVDDLWRRSLLYVRSSRRGPRLGMVDAVRSHVLAEDGTPSIVLEAERRHGQWFSRFGDAARLDGLRAQGGEKRFRSLTRDLEDLVFSCERALARGDLAIAEATGLAAATVLVRRGPWARGVALVRSLLDHPVQRRDDALLLLVELDAGGLEALDQAVAFAPTPRRRARAEGARIRWLASRQPQLARDEGLMALERARISGDRLAQGTLLVGLGIAHRSLGVPNQSESNLVEARALLDDLGDVVLSSYASMSLGNVLFNLSRYDEAWAAYRAAEDGFRAAGLRPAVATALSNQSMLHHTRRDDRAAERKARESLLLNREVGNEGGEASALKNLASALAGLDRHEEALASNARAIAIYRQEDEARALAFALSTQGHLLTSVDRLADARSAFEEALAVASQAGHSRSMSLALGNLAMLDRSEGHLPRALTRLDEAIVLSRGVDPRFEGMFHGERARVLMRLGEDPTAAIDRARELLEGGAPDGQHLVTCATAEHLAQQGRCDRARVLLDAIQTTDREVLRWVSQARELVDGV